MEKQDANAGADGPDSPTIIEEHPKHTPVFLRACPKCGKRFEVEKTAEKVQKNEEVVPTERTLMPVASIAGSYPIPVADPGAMTQKERVNEVVEDETHIQTYTCRHCGYTWTERYEEVKDVGTVEGTPSA